MIGSKRRDENWQRVGTTLGAGVYILVGDVAKFTAGPGVMISFLIAAVASVLSGIASVARAWSSNFDGILNGQIEEFFKKHLALNLPGLAEYVDPLAVGLIILMTTTLMRNNIKM
ncbi:unnamed protein product [Schistosoma mattheei]|uniref:Uncharacterized protein n=1 Tax=Schistosoma mattheei TaxID=31246 RepID=A0A183PBR5_9TREM|nr:unnamed protein product [Schistosoma mattheei]